MGNKFPAFDRNAPLIQTLKNALQHEQDRIDRANQEIFKIKMELLTLASSCLLANEPGNNSRTVEWR